MAAHAPPEPDCLQTPAENRRMFAAIANRYDLLNAVLSLGLDRVWRRRLVDEVLAAHPRCWLDLATGSGAVLSAAQWPAPPPTLRIGADPCLPLLRLGPRDGRALLAADALALPLRDGSCGAVTMAFGIRNVPDRARAFREIARALAPGGWLFLLEFSQPAPWLRRLYLAGLHTVCPALARALGADPSAYRYLAASIRRFPDAPALARELEQAGFADVRVRTFTLGVVALHSARKP